MGVNEEEERIDNLNERSIQISNKKASLKCEGC